MTKPISDEELARLRDVLTPDEDGYDKVVRIAAFMNARRVRALLARLDDAEARADIELRAHDAALACVDRLQARLDKYEARA